MAPQFEINKDNYTLIAQSNTSGFTKLFYPWKQIIEVSGSINNDYAIPSDSILIIRSNGIFGKKSLLIEPGFGDIIQDKYYEFTSTKDSYSVDMFLRYLNNLND